MVNHMQITNVAVIGAGVMGCGVALDLSSKGYAVTLCDKDEATLARARKSIKEQLRELIFFKKDILIKNYDELKLEYSNCIETLSNAECIIENITESIVDKKVLIKELSTHCSEGTILCINTSCIPITELAGNYHSPDKVIGTHFMNPAPLQKLVEMIRGFHTSDQTITIIKEFLTNLGKITILVNDSPGFVSNRLSHLLMNEAAFLVYEGVSPAKDIDKLFREGYGHKMGPLQTADLIGLDTVVHSLAVLFEQFQDPKFKCCPLLKKLVAAGYLGCKTGRGFYEY